MSRMDYDLRTQAASLAADTSLRPRPIANRPQDAILPYMWNL